MSPPEGLMSALASAHETGEYSDLTIICGPQKFPVHRIIVCKQSPILEAAIRHHCRERVTGEIELKNHDPEVVEHMISYFYHGNYPKPRGQNLLTGSPWTHVHAMSPPAVQSVEYTIDPLADLADAVEAQNSPAPAPHETEAHIDAADMADKKPSYRPEAGTDEGSDDNEQSEVDSELPEPDLLTHACVYAIADKYGIPGLKSLAKRKFADQIENHINSPDFPNVCEQVYEWSMTSDRGLRDVVLRTMDSYPHLLQRQDMSDMLEQNRDMTLECLLKFKGLPVRLCRSDSSR